MVSDNDNLKKKILKDLDGLGEKIEKNNKIKGKRKKEAFEAYKKARKILE